MTWNGPSTPFQGFINGVQVATNQSQGTDGFGEAGILRIGQSLSGHSYWFNGSIDEVRIYDRALSAAEVAALYAMENTPPPVAPSITITSPGEGQVITGATADLNVTITGDHDHWHYRIGSTFPANGSAGGTMVMSGSTVTLTGLAPGVHDVQVALVDASHNLLSPSATDSVSFTAQVANQAPVFAGGTATFTTAENNASASFVVTATDPDGDPLTYAKTGPDADKFDLNVTSGILTFLSPPDYEANASAAGNNAYQVTVTASDGTVSATVAVTVNVTDVYEAPPPDPNQPPDFGADNVNLTMPENNASATFVVSATDPDGDPLTYTLTGPDAAKFDLNATSGILRFLAPPDFEAGTGALGNNTYLLNVTVTDGAASAILNVMISVTDVYEAPPNQPPVFTGGSTFTTAENNASVSFIIGATDPDGDPLTYTKSGPDHAKFDLNAVTGELTFLSAPDYEANASVAGNNVYQLTVTVTDGEASATLAVTVDVTDVFENHPPTDIEMPSNFVLENQPVGTLVGTLHAVDPDDSNGTGAYVFEFVDGNGTANDQFTLDANGTVRTAAVFDYEAFDGNASLLIRAEVRDEHNASFVRSGEIFIHNEVEDLDGDGIEDHADPDDDNDGYSDAEELEAGTSPDSNASVPTAALAVEVTEGGDANGSGVFPRGTLALASAVAHEGFVFSHWEGEGVVDHNASETIVSMEISRTVTAIFHRQAYTVSAATISGEGAIEGVGEYLFEANATLLAAPAEGYSFAGWHILGPEGEVSLLLDNPLVFPVHGPLYLEAGFTLDNRAPELIALDHDLVDEGLPAGSVVGNLHAFDPDFNDTISFSFADGNGSQDNEFFLIDANGTLRTAEVFDHESKSLLSIRVAVDDGRGGRLEESFTVQVQNVFIPIVRTLPAGEATHDHVSLGAELLADGFSAVTEMGVIVSRDWWFPENDASTRRLPLDDSSGGFEVHVDGLESGVRYYFRAYAENSEGTALGAKKRFTTKRAPQTDPWANAVPLGDGWFNLSWFGSFRPFENNWIYHDQLGWAFVRGTSEESIWIWTNDWGWLWTSAEAFPHVHSHGQQSWLYFLSKDDAGKAVFFHYGVDLWLNEAP